MSTSIPSQPAPSLGTSGAHNTLIAAFTLVDLAGHTSGPWQIPAEGGGVGRTGDNWLPISDERVAPQHLWIEWDGQQVHVTDLSGDGATALGGVPLPAYEAWPWPTGEALQFAGFTLRLELFSPPAEITAELDTPNLRLDLDEPTTVQLLLTNVGETERSVSVEVAEPLSKLVRAPAAPVTLGPGARIAVPLEVAPARAAQLAAGAHPLVIRASGDGVSATAEGRWIMPPMVALSLVLRPEDYAAAYEDSAFTVDVRNDGNTPALASLSFASPEGLLGTLRPEAIELAPGETAAVDLTVRAPRRAVGDPQQRGFQVRATTDSGTQASVDGRFTQEPLISPWLAGAVALSALLVLLFLGIPLLFSGSTTSASTGLVSGDPALLATNQAAQALLDQNEAEIDNLEQQLAGASEATRPTIQALIEAREADNNAIEADLIALARRAETQAAEGTESALRSTAFANEVGTFAAQTSTSIATGATAQSASQTALAANQTQPAGVTPAPQASPETAATPTAAPSITDIELSKAEIDENAPASSILGTLSARGPQAGAAQLSLVEGEDGTDNKQFRLSGTSLLAVSSFNYEAKANLSIRVRADTGTPGASFDKVFTIKVNNLNEPPELTIQRNQEVTENLPAGSLVVLVTVTDPDAGDNVALELEEKAGFELVGDKLQTTQSFNFEAVPPEGPFDLVITARDSGNPSQETRTSVTVRVAPVNEAPTDIRITNGRVAENQSPGASAGTLSVIDPDGPNQSHTFTKIADVLDANLFNVDASSGAVTTAVGLDYESRNSNIYSIRVRVVDNALNPIPFEKDINIEVFNANDAPVAVADLNFQTQEDTALPVSAPGLLGNDTDQDRGDTLKINATEPSNALSDEPNGPGAILRSNGQEAGRLLVRSNGRVDFTPAANFSTPNGAPITFSYTIIDNAGTASILSAQVNIAVNPVNDPPAAKNVSGTVLENVSDKQIILDVTDPDSTPTVSAINNSEALSVTITQGTVPALVVTKGPTTTLIISPTGSVVGNVSFTYTVRDEQFSDTATVFIFIQAVNAPPVARADNLGSVNEDINETKPGNPPYLFSTNILANDSDPDNDSVYVQQISIGGVTQVLNGKDDTKTIGVPGSYILNVSGTGLVSTTLQPNFNGQINFSYVSTDGQATSASSVNVTIVVTPVNDAPQISDIADTLIVSNTNKAIMFTISDVDDNLDTLILEGFSSRASLVPNANIVFSGIGANRTVTVTPVVGQTGSATITITVTDSGPLSTSDMFNFTVTVTASSPGIKRLAMLPNKRPFLAVVHIGRSPLTIQ